MNWKSGVIGIFMAAQASAADADEPHREFGNPDAPFRLYCNELSTEGKVTAQFLRRMGNPDHMDAEDRALNNRAQKGEEITPRKRAHAYFRHLQRHGFTSNMLKKQRQICLDHHRDSFEND